MNKNIILTVVGPDKSGIVSNISEIVKNCSGNIDKSRMVRLGDFFTIIGLPIIPLLEKLRKLNANGIIK